MRKPHSLVVSNVLLIALLCGGEISIADSLPEPRTDLSYSYSDAGGDRISGPEWSITRRFARDTSVSALYEVDRVSAAAEDIAAPQTQRLDETRELGRLDIDFRDGTTIYSAGISRNSGNSYAGSLVRAAISQSLFHDLTTLAVGVSRGWDQTYRVLADTAERDPTYSGHAGRRGWWGTIDQIVTPSLRLTLDGGFLGQNGSLGLADSGVRFLLNDGLVATAAEVVPGTRGRYNLGLHGTYSLGTKGSVASGISYYYDSWGIRARAYDLTWRRNFRQDRLNLDLETRVYNQSHATFYTDLGNGLPTGDISRDRSLSRHQSLQVGGGINWQTRWHPHLGIQRWTTGIHLDLVRYQYADFRDLRVTGVAAGSEPYYRPTGFLAQLHLTGWF
jgi:hypothetical protein